MFLNNSVNNSTKRKNEKLTENVSKKPRTRSNTKKESEKKESNKKEIKKEKEFNSKKKSVKKNVPPPKDPPSDDDSTDEEDKEYDEEYDKEYDEEYDEEYDKEYDEYLKNNEDITIFLPSTKSSSLQKIFSKFISNKDNINDDYDDEYESDDSIKKNLKNELKDYKTYLNSLNRSELVYFRNLNTDIKENYIEAEKKIKNLNKNEIPMRFKILNSNLTDYHKSIALRHIETLDCLDKSNSEYHKINNWINALCRIPFGNYTKLPVTIDSTNVEIKEFIHSTKNYFNQKIYGHKNAKDQIVRILAQWISNPLSKGNVIGIHGNPGVGKTTLVKDCICKVLNLPFASIPLGGAFDSSFLDGHSYTYEGSTWGIIADNLMRVGCMNPVFYFDELDKVSDSWRGNEIINIMIHLTDPSQNSEFTDKYFSEIKFDLSKCLMIFTYNNDEIINPILKDRMIRINAEDYSKKDKIEIAKNFLLPSLYNQFAFKPEDITIDDEDLSYIIDKTDKEAGVRNLKRSLELIISNLNVKKLLEDDISTFTIDKNIIDTYIINKKSINPSIQHLYT